MKLKNGIQTIVFNMRFAAPYDHMNQGEVHGYPREEAEAILAAPRPAKLPAGVPPGPPAIDYQPRTLEEAKALERLVKDDLLDAKDADAAVNALVKIRVLDEETAGKLRRAHAAAEVARSAPAALGTDARQSVAALLAEMGHKRAAADVAAGNTDDKAAQARK